MAELTELKYEARKVSPKEMDLLLDEIAEERKLLRRVEHLSEANPMLGLRGCRLGLLVPEVTRMQVRAIFEAACEVQGEGVSVLPEVMIPLVSTPEEFRNQAALIREIAKQVMQEYGCELKYLVGTMIELPRAALVADKIAADAEFFSFGTNDLTQTTYGLSRDDSGRFLPLYVEKKIYPDDPFQSEIKNRRLRRTRRRPALHRVFQFARLGLRQLLAVSRAHRAPLVGALDAQ
jgi:pyruvate,orthophosphate dikinase